MNEEIALLDRVEQALLLRGGASSPAGAMAGLHDPPTFARAVARSLADPGHGGPRGAILRVEFGLHGPSPAPLPAVAEALLHIAVARLRGGLRSGDAVRREGASGFVCLLPGLRSDTEARRVGARLIARLGEPCCVEGRMLRCQPAVGAAVFPAAGGTLPLLMAAATRALGPPHGDATGLASVDWRR